MGFVANFSFICEGDNEHVSLWEGEERRKKSNRQRDFFLWGGDKFSFICQRDNENLLLRVGEERWKNSNRQRELLFEGGSGL